jgi:hypothetical protein
MPEEQEQSTESVSNGHEGYSEVNLYKIGVTSLLLCQVITIKERAQLQY